MNLRGKATASFGRRHGLKHRAEVSLAMLKTLLDWQLDNNIAYKGSVLCKQIRGIGMGIQTAPAEAQAVVTVDEEVFMSTGKCRRHQGLA